MYNYGEFNYIEKFVSQNFTELKYRVVACDVICC